MATASSSPGSIPTAALTTVYRAPPLGREGGEAAAGRFPADSDAGRLPTACSSPADVQRRAHLGQCAVAVPPVEVTLRSVARVVPAPAVRMLGAARAERIATVPAAMAHRTPPPTKPAPAPSATATRRRSVRSWSMRLRRSNDASVRSAAPICPRTARSRRSEPVRAPVPRSDGNATCTPAPTPSGMNRTERPIPWPQPGACAGSLRSHPGVGQEAAGGQHGAQLVEGNAVLAGDG